MQQFHRDLLREHDTVAVLPQVDDVLASVNVTTLIVKAIHNQGHLVVACFEVGCQVVVASNPVGGETLTARILRDEILRLLHITEDLEILVVSTIDVLPVAEISRVEHLLDASRHECVVSEVHQVQSLCQSRGVYPRASQRNLQSAEPVTGL